MTMQKQPPKKAPTTKPSSSTAVSTTKATDQQLLDAARAKQEIPITGEFKALELVRTRIREIREFVARGLMEKGVDYGTIPGVAKNMLFAAGSEMLQLNYGIVVDPPEIDQTGTDFERGVFRFYIVVKGYEYLKDEKGNIKQPTERIYKGFGAARISSFESKYRYRWYYSWQLSEGIKKFGIDPKTSKFDPEILKIYWINKNGEASFRFKQTAQGMRPQWRLENPDIHDVENTILKQGIIRANRALTLNVTGARRIFITDQEIEELGLSELDDVDFVDGEFKEVPEDAEVKPVQEEKAITPTPAASTEKVAPPPAKPGALQSVEKAKATAPAQTTKTAPATAPSPTPVQQPALTTAPAPAPAKVQDPGKRPCPIHSGVFHTEVKVAGGGTVWAHKVEGQFSETGKQKWCLWDDANALADLQFQVDAKKTTEPQQGTLSATAPSDMDSVNVKDNNEFITVVREASKKVWPEDTDVHLIKFLSTNYPTSGVVLEKLPVLVRKPILKDLEALYQFNLRKEKMES